MLKLSTNRKRALRKACTGGQEGPSHGLYPKKEMVGNTYIHTHTEEMKDQGCHINALKLRNFCFCITGSLRNEKTIYFNSEAYLCVIGSK